MVVHVLIEYHLFPSIPETTPATSRKTVTRTIRLDEDIDKLLEGIAYQNSVSVNSIVNSTLRRLVEWDVYAEKFGFTTLPTSLMRRMMEGIPNESIEQLGRWAGANFVKEFTQFWFKEVSLQTVLKTLDILGSKYVRAFRYEHVMEERKHMLVLNHGSGHKWSRFYQSLLDSALKTLLGIKVKIEPTDNQVVAEFVALEQTVTLPTDSS